MLRRRAPTKLRKEMKQRSKRHLMAPSKAAIMKRSRRLANWGNWRSRKPNNLLILELLRVARKNPAISIIKSQMRRARLSISIRPQVTMKTARSPEVGLSTTTIKPNMKTSWSRVATTRAAVRVEVEAATATWAGRSPTSPSRPSPTTSSRAWWKEEVL